MKYTFVIFACALFIAAAAADSNNEDTYINRDASDVADLTVDERKCIVDKVQSDPSVLTSLNACKNQGLTCINAIPKLASCFA
jgi:uncharacterized surface protein with fasciclin (FAS1) repeats